MLTETETEEAMKKLTEASLLEMHINKIMSVLQKDKNRFFKTSEITELVKEAPWANFKCIAPALELLLERKQIEHDPACGYCLPGRKKAIQRGLSTPGVNRAEFDKMSDKAKMRYVQEGGVIS